MNQAAGSVESRIHVSLKLKQLNLESIYHYFKKYESFRYSFKFNKIMFSELCSFVAFSLGKFTSPKLLFLNLGFSIF